MNRGIGHLVGKADNGEDMYHIIKNKEPDVVLLDLIMPKMDGLSVMELVQEDRNLKKNARFYYHNSNWTGTNYRRRL